jgi:hypothetical protein
MDVWDTDVMNVLDIMSPWSLAEDERRCSMSTPRNVRIFPDHAAALVATSLGRIIIDEYPMVPIPTLNHSAGESFNGDSG